MIRIHRVRLPQLLAKRLIEHTDELRVQQADGAAARTKWRNARAIKSQLTTHLTAMAPGVGRCMYCGDSEGTSIDHFEPLAQAPLRTFDWPNHFLACTHCNSHQKRDLFPRDKAGLPLLIDPTVEDPFDHLQLFLREGLYDHLTPKGRETVDVFGLNRTTLKIGRSRAFDEIRFLLQHRVHLLETTGNTENTDIIVALLHGRPFADVLYAMLRYRTHPEAARLLRGQDVVDALADPALHFWPH